ncbi:hypothetical protein ACJDU8_23010 [Clostridium sp. WILCCON 0269]|uniref:Transposase n=1 Tax=Candidatus Clostridium eludens TaxID=3381663 RepID=A0ABW8SQQ6_9CLOT
MDALKKDKLEMAVRLYFKGYTLNEAFEIVRHDDIQLDNNGKLYEPCTGETVCQDITTATDEQIRSLLQIKKRALIKRAK